MTALTLYPHQEIARDFLLTRKRCILADAPRVGKTLPTAAAAMQHLPVLVVCPAVAKPVWQKAFKQFGIEAVIVNGREMAAGCVPGGVLIVNYDLLPYMTAISGWQTLILDEVHRVKTPTTKRTKDGIKRIHVADWTYGHDDARRYPRPVFMIGDLPDKKKPKPNLRENRRRSEAQRNKILRMNSVFNMALTRDKIREIRRSL